MFSDIKVAILLVIQNEEKYLPAFFEHIKEQTHQNLCVYLFDNASTDNSVEVARMNYANILFFNSTVNLGYAKPNNFLANEAFNQGADYIFVLNPDIILDKNCVEILIAEHLNNIEIGILGPIILSGGTNIINSFGTIVNFNLYNEIWPYKNEIYSDKLPGINFVDTVGGGVTFLPRSVFYKTGLFEESYFVYGEEIDLGLRIKKSGLKAAVCSRAIVYRFHDPKKDEPFILTLVIIIKPDLFSYT